MSVIRAGFPGSFWEDILFHQKVYAIFDGRESHPDLHARTDKGLPALCLQFLSEQKRTWQNLHEGYELLKNVREREVRCSGFSVRLQCNPGRIKSSLANVREGNTAKDRCFLCPDHLPGGQRGILYRMEYLILCNPMPVFPSHFTISLLDHTPQSILESIDTFLQLISDFGSGWTILYNGPRCGASAPDHLHFQAVPSGWMPIEKEMAEIRRLAPAAQVDGVVLHRLGDLGREAVLMEGDDPMAIGKAFRGYLEALKRALVIDEEPMMNLAGSRLDTTSRLMIFPRRKHRPDAFFSEGEDRIVVSPGVIDMAGVLITPLERDFERLDAVAVEEIYREVSLEGRTVKRSIDTLRQRAKCMPHSVKRDL